MIFQKNENISIEKRYSKDNNNNIHSLNIKFFNSTIYVNVIENNKYSCGIITLL